MARPSKLTEAQWNEIVRRNTMDKESIRSLAREFGIAEHTVRQRVKSQVADIKDVANQLAAANNNLHKLPPYSQVLTLDLAHILTDISKHLAAAAKNGAATAHRLSGIAHSYTEMIDDSAPLDVNRETLDAVTAFQAVANEASKIGLNLLAANNKDNARLHSVEADAEKVPDDPIEASRAYQQMIGS